MEKEKKKKSLRVVDETNMESWVKAKLICELPLTDPKVKTAWKGTAEVYQDENGKYYLNHKEYAETISDNFARALISSKDSHEQIEKLLN